MGYPKPGVYVNETLAPSLPVVADASQTAAVFIGVADRGPTTTAGNGNTVGVPTLVTSWSDFITSFGYGSSVDLWSYGASGAADLRYALRSFFDNNGSPAYVVRVVNTDAKSAAWTLRGITSILGTSGSVTFSSVANGVQIIATGNVPSTLTAGSVVSFATTPTTLVGTTFAVRSVDTANNAFTVYSTGAGGTIASTIASVAPTYSVATTGAIGLTISANGSGTWANNAFVNVTPSALSGYFDIAILYSTTSTASANTTSAYTIQSISTLNLNTNDNQSYAASKVSSPYITVTGNNVTSTVSVTNLMPTYYVNADYSLTQGPIQLGNPSGSSASMSSATTPGLAVVTTAADGTTNGYSISDITNQIDAISAVTGPVLLNWPTNKTASYTDPAKSLINYASTRGDAFVVVDGINTKTFATAISHVSDLKNAVYSTAPSYGAVYYPFITIKDPAYSAGTKDIPPGGAVMAAILNTDNQRGTFKAPAGAQTTLRPAVNVTYALTNDDFTLNSTSYPQLNVIRVVPGSNFCVMGARSLSNNLQDVFIPVRRTLGYIRKNLVNRTTPYVFEPNNAVTWAQVKSDVENFLYNLWNLGGLNGATPQQAYYVKCDSTINTPSTINNGELNIEVGVALSRPAEFVVIKLGQTQGGSTLTTSV